MAATTKVKDFIWRVSTALNDSSAQYVSWLETEIVMAINDGMVAICKVYPAACSRLDTLQLRASSYQTLAGIAAASCKPADGSTPATVTNGRQILSIECNMTAAGTIEGRAVRLVSRSDMDLNDPDWRTRAGTAVEVYMLDDNQNDVYYVSPKPSDTSQWLRVSYAVIPTPIPAGNDSVSVYLFTGGSTTLLPIDDANVDDLLWYVLARMNMKDTAVAKPAMVTMAAQMFAASMGTQQTSQDGASPKRIALPDVVGGG